MTSTLVVMDSWKPQRTEPKSSDFRLFYPSFFDLDGNYHDNWIKHGNYLDGPCKLFRSPPIDMQSKKNKTFCINCTYSLSKHI